MFLNEKAQYSGTEDYHQIYKIFAQSLKILMDLTL